MLCQLDRRCEWPQVIRIQVWSISIQLIINSYSDSFEKHLIKIDYQICCLFSKTWKKCFGKWWRKWTKFYFSRNDFPSTTNTSFLYSHDISNCFNYEHLCIFSFINEVSRSNSSMISLANPHNELCFLLMEIVQNTSIYSKRVNKLNFWIFFSFARLNSEFSHKISFSRQKWPIILFEFSNSS